MGWANYFQGGSLKARMRLAGDAWRAAGWVSYVTPHSLQYINTLTGERFGIARRAGRSSRVGRIAKRIARYALLGTAMYAGGFAAGLYLPLGWTATVTTGIALAGGARATILAAEDLSRITVFKESDFLRQIVAGKIGVGFGLLPFAGALHGTIRWTIREAKRMARTIDKGRNRAVPYRYRGFLHF
jgi:hypothetical protein